ncbi:bifunctional S-adenosyl-L-methionine-dependent methyltransferase superfamily/Methyltransferase domain 25/Protein arginine N-methyltransferase [Babesia duncani]|uniref:type I protein arginine methyltransferase n=1 Tax=Babesia duncani TaxID=323732 RepID=A0AAD9PID0_9APIC|nr:bifunctional S-adenosyl-L-methionine-dependent methyltransferase superfamily/Methyltransferase domain 25/Protein arginine N-methyltransferase [Babesia duncani]
MRIHGNMFSTEEMEQFSTEWSEFATDVNPPASPEDVYFSSYGYIGIHEEMLKDSVRTGTYYRAISQNKHLFRDKIVLDIGCGTGILSLFCVAAGAAHVYAIDCSSIIHLAENIAKMNGVADRITFIHGKCEQVELPVESVDIIISEWMGYFLLYENMLPSVLHCRDKWLKPGGLIFPDKARLYAAGIDDAEFKQERFGSWRDLYGFDFTLLSQYLMEEPLVDTVDEKAIKTSTACILTLDLNTCKAEDLEFCSSFLLVAERKDYVHALVFWFDVVFSACHKPLVLTTSPRAKYTHWKQTVFYIEDDMVVEPGDHIKGKIAVRKNARNPRDLDVKLWYQLDGLKLQKKRHVYR